ncbi:endolysin [Gordonia phage Neville]|uniref:Lysin A, protease C39 domain n=2 Tax=Nevillevirus TaxID=3044773 RepID=A0A515MGW9_9CAUD|nr:endolysin [Gordonia phage Neville]YP_010246019.1 endolysin [Gordonia phage Trax]AXQ64406.1 lysin A, protease C39 domain [Gordonia phage Neville]QDM55921.1 lysin A, protease C39 domain [Gordonia phage Trax]
MQNIASSRKRIEERDLAREMKTTTNGTNHIGLLAAALHKHLGVLYATVLIGGADATKKQQDKLWADIKASVDGGYGVAMNWIAPVGGYPKGQLGSPNPRYGGGDVYHYVAAMGYAEENGKRYVFIADSGFSPFQYWVTLEQCATLIAGKGYAYAVVPVEIEADPVNAAVREVFAPLSLLVKDVRAQLTGSRTAGRFDGWPQLGKQTVVDALGEVRRVVSRG